MFYDVWTRQGVSGNGVSMFLAPVSSSLFSFVGMNFLKMDSPNCKGLGCAKGPH